MIQPVRKKVIDIVRHSVESIESLETYAFQAKRPPLEQKAIKEIEIRGLELLAILNSVDHEITVVEVIPVKLYLNMCDELIQYIKSSLDALKKLN